jgi:hypothetical protein
MPSSRRTNQRKLWRSPVVFLPIWTKLPHLRQMVERTANDLILGRIDTVLVELAYNLPSFKAALFHAGCELNTAAYPAKSSSSGI